MTQPLSDSEQLAFAALLRTALRLEGPPQPETFAVVDEVASELFGSPTEVPSADGVDPSASARLWALVDRAELSVPDDDAVREVAAGVTRTEAREAIYGAIEAVARTGSIQGSESWLLDWLASTWQIRREG